MFLIVEAFEQLVSEVYYDIGYNATMPPARPALTILPASPTVSAKCINWFSDNVKCRKDAITLLECGYHIMDNIRTRTVPLHENIFQLVTLCFSYSIASDPVYTLERAVKSNHTAIYELCLSKIALMTIPIPDIVSVVSELLRSSRKTHYVMHTCAKTTSQSRTIAVQALLSF